MSRNFEPSNLNVYSIKTLDGVRQFFNYLIFEKHINFHPDERFENCTTAEECQLYNKWMAECFKVCKDQGVDIYQLIPSNIEIQPQMSKAKQLPVYNIALCATEFHFTDYNGLKVHPVEIIAPGMVEQCDDDEADYFGVYVHKLSGGLECIADTENKDDAECLQAIIQRITSQVKQPYIDILKRAVRAFNTIPKKHVGIEDTYMIASDIDKLLKID